MAGCLMSESVRIAMSFLNARMRSNDQRRTPAALIDKRVRLHKRLGSVISAGTGEAGRGLMPYSHPG